jgi:hypothetical protein
VRDAENRGEWDDLAKNRGLCSEEGTIFRLPAEIFDPVALRELNHTSTVRLSGFV